MLNRLWLLFAQTITILLAAWFVVMTLKPEWLSEVSITHLNGTISLRESDIDERQPSKSNPADPLFKFFFGDRPTEEEPSPSLGSGVIVSPEGIILTSHHVISNADDIDVAPADGRKFKAKIIGGDPETDIAVLKIEANQLPTPITLRKINSVHVGDVVLVIGNPFGFGHTVTSGILSALGRDHVGINTFKSFIQIDAAINPGNSGGALIDTRGNLIGINTAIFFNSGGSMGIGFAIPVNLAKQVMELVIKSGGVTRGWIGVEPQNLNKELSEPLGLPGNIKGVLLSGVLEGGPADRGGIKTSDILTSVNSKQISDVRDLLNQVAGLEPGIESSITLLRKGKDLELKVHIGKRPKSKYKK